MNLKRLEWIAVAAVCMTPGGMMLHAQMPNAPKPVVAVAKVTEAEDMESRRYTGRVVSQSVVQIVPRVSGEILEVGFQDGGLVKKGQLLYKLDEVQYLAAVKNAEAKIAENTARLNYAQSNYNRNKLLFEKDAASRDSMENTKAALEAYKAAMLAAEADLIKAQDNLNNTRIVAPIDGIVGVSKYTQGNYITPSSGVLLTIIRVSPVRVRFSISTADYLSMFGSLEKLKQEGDLKIKLSDGTMLKEQGAVEFLNNEANEKTDAIQVYALFPNQNNSLIVGSTVTVTLSKRQGQVLAAVPPSAVMHDSEGSFVYVIGKDNSTVEKRYIEPGNATADFQLVKKGLTKGETVISKGTHKTRAGAQVEAVPEGADANAK